MTQLEQAATDLLKASEVAFALRAGRSTVYRLIRTGELPAVTFGGSVRVPRWALEEIIGSATEQEDLE